MTISYGTGQKKKATVLHSKIVRSAGRCIRCGRTENLQCAHIIRRTYAWTRTDETNAWCLDAKCHFFLDSNPDEFMSFVEQTIGFDAFYRLKKKANDGVGRKFDWSVERVRLQAIWDAIRERAA